MCKTWGLFVLVSFLCISSTLGGVSFPGSANTWCSAFKFSLTLLNGRYRLCWTPSEDNSTVHIGMQAIGSGYVAWGIGDQMGSGMNNGGDIWSGYFGEGGVATVADTWSTTSGEAPALDATQNVVGGSVSGSRSSGVSSFQFIRAVDTGDTINDRVIAPGILEILVAYGREDNINDVHIDKGLAYVNMFTGEGPPVGAQTTSTRAVDPSSFSFKGPLGTAPYNCTFYWSIVGGATLDAALTCNVQGWIAFGLSNQAGGGMTNCDVVTGQVVGTTMVVADRWSASQQAPSYDIPAAPQGSLIAVDGSRIGTLTTIWWSRALNTNDAKDRPIVPGLMEVNFAINPTTDVFAYHDKNRATTYIDFINGIIPMSGATTALVDATWDPTAYPNRFNVIPGVFEFYWNLVIPASGGTPTSVNMAIRVARIGWAALGPAASGAGLMTGADVMMVTFDPVTGAPIVDDQTCIGQSTPISDTVKGGSASFTNIAGNRNSTGMQIKWTRLLDTGDSVADIVLSSSGLVTFIVAFGDSSSPTYHISDRATFAVDLSTGAGSVSASQDTLRIVHGSLMVFAFGFCMALGSFIAFTVPKNQVWWFPAHWIIQAFAGLLMMIAFFVIIAYYENTPAVHFRTNSRTMGAHAILGIITICFVIMQIVLGIVADRVWHSEHKKTGAFPEPKAFPDMVHWWLGRSILVLAIIVVFLGITEMGYGWPFYIGWMIWCVLVIAAFVAGFLWKWKTGKLGAGASSH